jgi:hypothetical protein
MPATRFTRICLATLALACAPALRAQAPAYARGPGDTLRYRERMEAAVETQGRPGRGQLTQDARISILFTRGDTAQAWYEVLRTRAKHGNGVEELDIPRAGMRGGFTLAVTPAGRLRTLALPVLPPPLDVEFDSVLVWQFLDFLPVLPDAPLRPGLEWTDADSAASPGARWTRSTRSRVVRDTVVDGVRAVVVQTEARIRMRRTSALDEELSFRTEMEGTELGRFVFAPVPGVLLRRERTGTLQGTETTQLEGESPRSARQTREYTITLELLSGPRR